MANITDVIECLPVDILSFNFSEFEYSGTKEFSSESLTWRENLKIAFYVVIMSMSLIGNTGIILTVYCNRAMRNTINFYLVNLAVTGILISIFCMWVHLVNNLTQPLFILGPVMCKVNGFTQMTCLTCSVLTLTAISCDRFVAILFPFRARITKQRTGVVIIVIWLIALAAATPFLVYREYFQIQWKNFAQAHCDGIWPPSIDYDESLQKCVTTYPSKQLYYTFVAVILFFVPVAIMAATYFLIIWRLWVSEIPGERNPVNMEIQRRSKKKVIKLVCILLIAFVACWLPLQVIILYSQFVHSSTQIGELPKWFSTVSFFANFFAYFNSALNPIIYGGFNNNFRKNFCLVVKCGYRDSHVRRFQQLISGNCKKSSSTLTSATSPKLLSGKCFEYRKNQTSRHKAGLDNEQRNIENQNLATFSSTTCLSKGRNSTRGNDSMRSQMLKTTLKRKLEHRV